MFQLKILKQRATVNQEIIRILIPLFTIHFIQPSSYSVNEQIIKILIHHFIIHRLMKQVINLFNKTKGAII